MNSFNQSQTIGNDRLRKAIERNRAKQLKKTVPRPVQNREKDFHDYFEKRQSKAENISSTHSYGVPNESDVKRQIRTRAPKKRLRFNPFKKIIERLKTKKANSLLVMIAWLFNGFLLLRLIFASNGIIDYYAMEGKLNEQKEKIKKNKQENLDLAAEIHEIKVNKSYQKKLARDHLGVIGKDEFLILFPQEKQN